MTFIEGNIPVNIQDYNSAMKALSEMPVYQGHELDFLLAKFHQSADRVAGDEQAFLQMCRALQEFNPYFSPQEYSLQPKANVLANVVAAIYSPLIHSFSQTVLKNIGLGNIPETLIAPPRDTIPLVTSFEAITKVKGRSLRIIRPPITRITAGIPNNQLDMQAKEDPLFRLMVYQTFNHHYSGKGLTELETGIYSTTSLKLASLLKKEGISQFVPIKFYGLGPNLSYVHALLSSGGEWIAEKAESERLVDARQIASLMVLLDSLEEFGMQNMHQSIGVLKLNSQGVVVPVIIPVDDNTLEVARATNKAIHDTAGQYLDDHILDLSLELLDSIPQLTELSKAGFPFTLSAPIPPMDNKDSHFEAIRSAQVFDYPKLVL